MRQLAAKEIRDLTAKSNISCSVVKPGDEANPLYIFLSETVVAIDSDPFLLLSTPVRFQQKVLKKVIFQQNKKSAPFLKIDYYDAKHMEETCTTVSDRYNGVEPVFEVTDVWLNGDNGVSFIICSSASPRLKEASEGLAAIDFQTSFSPFSLHNFAVFLHRK